MGKDLEEDSRLASIIRLIQDYFTNLTHLFWSYSVKNWWRYELRAGYFPDLGS